MTRTLLAPLALLVLASGLAACSTTNPDYPPPSPLDTTYTSCEVPEDCVIVSLGCCDACNGGTEVSVNTQSAQTVRDLYSETCAGQLVCTDLGCAPTLATCDAGVCGSAPGSF